MIRIKTIHEKLSKKEARELLKLTEIYYPIPDFLLADQEKRLENAKTRSRFGNNFVKKVKECRRIHTLYLKITSDEKDYIHNWGLLNQTRKTKETSSVAFNEILTPKRSIINNILSIFTKNKYDNTSTNLQ